MRTFLIVASLVTLLLSGCKGGDSDDPPFCRAIGGGSAVASNGDCRVNCGQENIQASVDANFTSFATLHLSVQGEGTLRGTAQDGLVFSGPAGVHVHKPPLTSGVTFDLVVSTFLDGALQQSALAYSESGATSGNTFCNYCASDGERTFIGIPTDGQFDAIEIAYTQSGGTQSREIKVFEFCVLD